MKKNTSKPTVGQYLNEWRISKEVSLKDFSKLTKMSVANLCDIEKGRTGVSPEKAEKIAKAMRIPPALLVRLAIEQSLRASGLKYKVEIKSAS